MTPSSPSSGSGADRDQPVLSSGTWEILMVRSTQAHLAPEDYADGATAEFDAEPGLLNPGLQWLGSGIIEWVNPPASGEKRTTSWTQKRK